eukprot:gene1248-18940_t
MKMRSGAAAAPRRGGGHGLGVPDAGAPRRAIRFGGSGGRAPDLESRPTFQCAATKD